MISFALPRIVRPLVKSVNLVIPLMTDQAAEALAVFLRYDLIVLPSGDLSTGAGREG